MIRASKESAAQAKSHIETVERLSDRLISRNAGLNAKDWKTLRASLDFLKHFTDAAQTPSRVFLRAGQEPR